MKKLLPVLMGLALMTTAVSASEWPDNIKIKGDFRYRHEMIKKGAEETRNRHRMRARIGIEGKVNEFTNVGFRLTSGSDDPVSTNQTLDDGFSSKSLMLDLAYVTIKSSFVEGLSITGGKFKNLFYKPGKSELIWDSDWNPEGGAIDYEVNYKSVKVRFVGAGLWIEERSADKDSWLGALETNLKLNLNQEKSRIVIGGGFFNYANADGFEPFFDGDPRGNSIDSGGFYANEYELIELFAEINHEISEIPITVMGDYVTNSGSDSLNTGWLVGVRVGKAKDPGSWDMRYNYRELEKDAVVGVYTNSDFGGGGTDANGHEFGGGYQIAKNMKFNLTYFINNIGLTEAETSDYERFQADLLLKF